MDDEDISRIARAFGFARALELCPDDVRDAALRAVAQRAQLDAPEDPACEPWPPMQCQPES